MSTDGSDLDEWGYALFSIETIMNVVFIPLIFCFFYICVAQKNLHPNFRVCLFMAGIGYLGADIIRIAIASIRMCCEGINAPLVLDLSRYLMTGSDFAMFGWLFAVVERAIATVFSGIYEIRYAACTIGVLLCCMNVLLTVSLMCMYRYCQTCDLGIYLIAVNTVVVLLCVIALGGIIKFNDSKYRNRHESMKRLAEKYQLAENIRSAKYLICIAINDFICRIIFVALMWYSAILKGTPMQSDKSLFPHAYDILFAYQRLFAGLALTFQSETFCQLIQQRKRTTQIVDGRNDAADIYFGKLKQMLT
uniref:G protein-coupled receptor n=1 Tax=Haemonchus contortus TaxID=6289 RepID=A0A7I5E8C3_HAECO